MYTLYIRSHHRELVLMLVLVLRGFPIDFTAARTQKTETRLEKKMCL